MRPRLQRTEPPITREQNPLHSVHRSGILRYLVLAGVSRKMAVVMLFYM